MKSIQKFVLRLCSLCYRAYFAFLFFVQPIVLVRSPREYRCDRYGCVRVPHFLTLLTLYFILTVCCESGSKSTSCKHSSPKLADATRSSLERSRVSAAPCTYFTTLSYRYLMAYFHIAKKRSRYICYSSVSLPTQESSKGKIICSPLNKP